MLGLGCGDRRCHIWGEDLGMATLLLGSEHRDTWVSLGLGHGDRRCYVWSGGLGIVTLLLGVGCGDPCLCLGTGCWDTWMEVGTLVWHLGTQGSLLLESGCGDTRVRGWDMGTLQ